MSREIDFLAVEMGSSKSKAESSHLRSPTQWTVAMSQEIDSLAVEMGSSK
jgi:hypothetical protein